MLKGYKNFSNKVLGKVKRAITRAQNKTLTERITEKLDEKMYSILDKVEDIAWRMRYTLCPDTDFLWRTRSKLRRMKERIEEQSSDEDLDLELFLELYGGEK